LPLLLPLPLLLTLRLLLLQRVARSTVCRGRHRCSQVAPEGCYLGAGRLVPALQPPRRDGRPPLHHPLQLTSAARGWSVRCCCQPDGGDEWALPGGAGRPLTREFGGVSQTTQTNATAGTYSAY
jgi:hypothetical protein